MVDARSIEPEPNVNHPFTDCPIEELVNDKNSGPKRDLHPRELMVSKPNKGQQESEETPMKMLAHENGNITSTTAYQPASTVSREKSAIMDRRDRKRMLSESKLNAKRGISTGAPIASTSRACCPSSWS